MRACYGEWLVNMTIILLMYRMVVLAKLNTLVKQWIIDISLSKVSLIVVK